MQNDLVQCEQLYRDLCRCSIEKNRAGLMAVLAPDYVLVHMTGMKQSREEFIDAVLDGTLNYYSAVHDVVKAIEGVPGEKIRICGRSQIEAAVFGGGRHTWHLQQDLVARNRNGRWFLTESRASTY